MEPNLVVYKPFGVLTENDMFDDVKTYSLWPVNTSLPKLIQLAIFTDDAPGANGINGIETAYEVNLGGKPVFTKHGELSGKRHVIDAGECNIVKITATVVKDPAKPVLRALAFELADGSKLGS
ncbi:hypothetical protein H0H92_010413 [Tricholoma furcatifolium]|nr:hypothetical protein H0H92_010413 [Tricholoma furcatifolium]